MLNLPLSSFVNLNIYDVVQLQIIVIADSQSSHNRRRQYGKCARLYGSFSYLPIFPTYNNSLVLSFVVQRNRNIKPKMDGTPGKKVIRPCSVHYSNVMLVDPSTG